VELEDKQSQALSKDWENSKFRALSRQATPKKEARN
jgi:hypothetical protein